MKATKIIRDIVHGYISLDEFFTKLIDNKHFQRLRNIKQLTSQYVYPSANHTRFEHSLGVYYLANLYVENLKEAMMNNGINDDEYKKFSLNVFIAALLHDIGHAPLSHLGEKYYSKNDIITSIKPLCNLHSVDSNIFEKGANHERMSCYIILQYYVDIIRTSLINNDVYKYEDIDFEWICRMIVGCKYADYKLWHRNIGIEIINSDTVDADKLDYIIRDSYMTGISVPSIDVRRLFASLYIHPDNKKIVFHKQAITVIQNIIDSRDCLYMLTCNHHTAIYTDFLLEYYIRHLILLHQKKDNNYISTLNPIDFFSCNAIGKLLMSDNEILEYLRKYYVENHPNISNFTKIVSKQFFGRKFLKPLWKNLYEFEHFLDCNIGDDYLITNIKNKLSSEDSSYRIYVVKEIRKNLNLEDGSVFIIPRSNKFSKTSQKKFYIYCGDEKGLQDIGSLLPQKRYHEMFDNKLFYVYVDRDRKKMIKDKLIEILKKPLPDEIVEKCEVIDWL